MTGSSPTFGTGPRAARRFPPLHTRTQPLIPQPCMSGPPSSILPPPTMIRIAGNISKSAGRDAGGDGVRCETTPCKVDFCGFRGCPHRANSPFERRLRRSSGCGHRRWSLMLRRAEGPSRSMSSRRLPPAARLLSTIRMAPVRMVGLAGPNQPQAVFGCEIRSPNPAAIPLRLQLGAGQRQKAPDMKSGPSFPPPSRWPAERGTAISFEGRPCNP